MADDLSALIASVGRQAEAKASGGVAAPDVNAPGLGGTGIGGFLESVISPNLELFGAPPTPGSQQFNEEHPVLGFGGAMLGIGGQYGAYAKAAEKIPLIQRGIEAAGKMSEVPIISGAMKNVTRYAPLEAAHVLGAAATNPENTGETAAMAGLNLGIEAALGGVGAMLGAGGKSISAAEKTKTQFAPLKGAAQGKIRDLNEAITGGKFAPETIPKVQNEIKGLESQVRLETVGEKLKAVGDLELGDAKDINRLFREGGSTGGQVRRSRLANTLTDFQSPGELKRVSAAAGLDGNWDAVSLPRYVGFSASANKGVAAKVEKDLIDRALFTQVGDNTLMGKEKNGLFVMAKKITGEIGVHAPSDEWVMFKTDQPNRFNKTVSDFVEKQQAELAFSREPLPQPTGNPNLSILDKSVQMVRQTPMINYLSMSEKGGIGKGYDFIRKSFGWPEAERGSSFIAQRGRSMVDTYMTPLINQFSDSPRAQWLLLHSQMINGMYRKAADEIMFGEYVSNAAKGMSKLFKEPETSGMASGFKSIKPMIEKMTPEDISAAIHATEDMTAHLDDMAETGAYINKLYSEGHINDKVHEFLTNSDHFDQETVRKMQALQQQVGVQEFSPLPGHVMISRTWEGDYRSLIQNEAGEKLFVAGGKSPAIADARARAIMAEGEKQGLKGLTHVPAEAFDAARDIELGQQIRSRSDQFKTLSQIARKLRQEPGKSLTMSKERTGMGGYQMDFTPQEFTDKLRNHVSERYKYMSQLNRKYVLGDEFQKLLIEDPKTFNSLNLRMTDLDGQQGTLGKMQNAAVDKILGPAMGGRNSASKIVDTINEYQYHMNFGSFNLAFPAINALTFVQTVAPEVAFVAHASESALHSKYYGTFLSLGTDRKPRGLMGFLDPAKLTLQAMKEMAKPGPLTNKLVDRALSEGVIDPKLTAEFMGDTSKFRTTLKDVMTGREPFLNFIKTVSTSLPENSERIARAHAFVTGRLVGEELLNITDPERLFTFAKQFTQRTMYGYQTVDRPQMFTSPMGRTFGLFKNWQAHYISNMLVYAGEFNKGNFAPLLWQMGGTGAVGGLAAQPVMGVANGLSKMMTDKTVMQNFYSAYGNSDASQPMGNVHDAVFWGLPAFLGLTISGNVSAPGANPARDAAGLMSFPQWQRASDLAAAVGGAFDTWGATDKHPAQSPDVMRKMALAVLPKTMQRYIAGTQGDIVSLRSGKIEAQGMTDYEMLMYKLGFTPKRLGVNQRVQSELWDDQNALRAEITTMGRVWMEAQNAKDWDATAALTRQAMLKKIPIDSVIRSANTQNQKSTKLAIDNQFSPLKIQPYRDLGLLE